MSRQRGRRERPAPERRAIRERYSSRDRRRERRSLTERPQWTGSISSGRRWAAVMGGTVVAVTAFGLVAAAVVEAGDGDNVMAAWLAAGAAVAVPVLLATVGFISRAPHPWQTMLYASPVVMLGFLVASFVAREPATGFVLGIGIGGALAMRSDEGVHKRSWRIWTAVALALYTKIVYLASPGVAIIAAPLLPLAGIGLIDRMAERRLGG